MRQGKVMFDRGKFLKEVENSGMGLKEISILMGKKETYLLGILLNGKSISAKDEKEIMRIISRNRKNVCPVAEETESKLKNLAPGIKMILENGNPSVDLLTGVLSEARKNGASVAMVNIPVRLLAIDTNYQVPDRTDRDVTYLINNWEDIQLMPLQGVPHWEEGVIAVTNGYGRVVAANRIDKKKYEYMQVIVLLDVPSNPEDRQLVEAKMYACQDTNVFKMREIHKHGARLIMHDNNAEILENMKEKWGFEYKACKGKRKGNVLGSYPDILSMCSIDNGKCIDYVFEVCYLSGFDRKENGYATYITRAIRDIYKIFANDRDATKEYLGKFLRKIDPLILKANAVSRYPMVDFRAAVSLFLEDQIVNSLMLERARTVNGSKVVSLNGKRTA